MELKNILTGVADRLSSLREGRPSAGTKYRLMGMVADITEATETLSKEVLERVYIEGTPFVYLISSHLYQNFRIFAD